MRWEDRLWDQGEAELGQHTAPLRALGSQTRAGLAARPDLFGPWEKDMDTAWASSRGLHIGARPTAKEVTLPIFRISSPAFGLGQTGGPPVPWIFSFKE